MQRRAISATAGTLALILALGSCGQEEPTVTSLGGPVTDEVSLVDNLRAVGAAVEPAGELSQPFFSVTGRILRINGEDVQVFQYPDTATARQEAALVASDGSTVGTSVISWVGPPHFYRSGRLIVLYVGDSGQVLAPLEAVLGPQFAGM